MSKALTEYLDELTRESTPPILSEEETMNLTLARERMLTLRIPILTHWYLHKAAQAVGQSKTSLAEEIIARAAQDVFEKLQTTGHLSPMQSLNEAMEYYRSTTKQGEASEPGGEIEFVVVNSNLSADELEQHIGKDIAAQVEPVINRKARK